MRFPSPPSRSAAGRLAAVGAAVVVALLMVMSGPRTPHIDGRTSGDATLLELATHHSGLPNFLWRSGSVDGREVYSHEGSMPWGTTYVALDPASGRAVVVLANTFVSGVEDLGLALLTGSDRSLDPFPNTYIYLGPSATILLVLGLWGAWRSEHPGSRLAVGIRTAGLAAWAALAVVGGPWDLVPGWTCALAVLPGAYAVARMVWRWRELPWQPGPARLRWWLWARLVLCLAFAGLVLLIVVPKG